MRFLMLSLLLCAPALPFVSSNAQDYPVERNWEAVCESAKAKPLQTPNLTGPLSPSQLPQCDTQKLYYGDGVQKPNYPAALQCGWYERTHPDPHVGDMFLGPGVLTMLYANGHGVPQNYGLAIRFACEDQWTSEAEGAARIGHLEAMRDGTDKGKFDLCDDITSGLSMGACQAIDSMRYAGPRANKIAAEAAALPAPAKASLPALQRAEKAFEEERSGNEVDMSGTARGMFYEQELSTLSDQFLINLQRFRKDDVPAATPHDLAELDAKLNTAYRSLMNAPADKWEFGTIKPDGIRKTERAWLNLVDAWMRFGHAAYPQLSETRLRAQLIRLRLHQLQSLAQD